MPPVQLKSVQGKPVLPGATTDPPLEPTPPVKVLTPEPEPEVKPPPPAVSKLCPHCGVSPDTPIVEVTPDDVAAFVKAVLTDTPFTREYQLFGGAISIRYRTLSSDETEATHNEAARNDTNPLPETTVGTWSRFQSAVTLHAAMSVETVVIGGVTYRRPDKATPAESLQWFSDRFKMAVTTAAARQAFLKFADLTATVQRKALDPSFFQATAVSGPASVSPQPASRV